MSGGTFLNQGQIGTFTMSGGTLDTAAGYIETLYYSGGNITSSGENIGEIIYVDNAAAGADAGVIDNADFGNAGWQDVAPMGEEVIVW